MPTPNPNEKVSDEFPTGTELEVCRDIARRQRMGLVKYRVTVAENNLPLIAWLQHAYEESLDLSIYLKRTIDMITEHERRTE